MWNCALVPASFKETSEIRTGRSTAKTGNERQEQHSLNMDQWVKKFAEFMDLSKEEGLSQAGKRCVCNVPNTRRLSLRKGLTRQAAFHTLPLGTGVSS